MASILVEERKEAFSKLQTFAANNSSPGFNVHALQGEFIHQIPKIKQIVERTSANPFRFIFLDPKGWADMPMQKLQPFVRDRSCEVLITLMTRHIIRFLKEHSHEASYRDLFARPGVLEALRATAQGERVDRAVEEYSMSLRLLCGFKSVSSAVILEPDAESVRYFLIYATNHPRGVEVFKNAEIKAARIQEEVRYETQVERSLQPSLVFSDESPSSPLSLKLRKRYLKKARKKLLDLLSRKSHPAGIAYSDCFSQVMQFPLVTPYDLIRWLTELQGLIEIRLAGSKHRKKPSPMEDDRVLVTDAKTLGQLI